MAQLQNRTPANHHDWIKRVTTLVDQVAGWAQSEGWNIQRDIKEMHEPLLGSYQLPSLTIQLPGGELTLNPIGLQIAGGDGRVDIEATPTLNRVRLIGANGNWIVMTDSNVPLRITWDASHFAELARDLLA